MGSDPKLSTEQYDAKIKHYLAELEREKVHLEQQKQFNENQIDTRKRVDTLGRYILVANGIALTASIGLFASPESRLLTDSAATHLQWSWGLLFLSIVLMLFVILSMIYGGYVLGEQWRKVLEDELTETELPRWIDWVAWGSGAVGALSFVVGLLLLGLVAISVIPSSPLLSCI